MKIQHIASRNFDPFEPDRLKEALASEWTITTTPDDSAVDVAKQVDAGNVDVIIVMSSPDEPLGIVAPQKLMTNLAEHLDIREPSFEQALRAFEANPEERRRDFEHEWVRAERIDLDWCRRGMHYTVLPCSRH